MPALLREPRLRRDQGIGLPAAPWPSTQLSGTSGSRGRPRPHGAVDRHRRGRRARHGRGWPRPASAAASSRSRRRVQRRRGDPRSGRGSGRGHRRSTSRPSSSGAPRESSTEQGRPAGRRSWPPTRPTPRRPRRTGFAQLLAQDLDAPGGAHPCQRQRRYRSAARRDAAGPVHRRRRAAREAGGGRAGRGRVPGRALAAVPDGGPAGPAATRPGDGQRDPRRRGAALRAR